MTDTLDYLRRMAKRLRRDLKREDPAALQRAQSVFPNRQTLTHTEALHVIAKERGATSWPQLKLSFEIAQMDRKARAERLKLALFLGQARAVSQLLEADPTLPEHNFGLLCATYHVARVQRALSRDPSAATRVVGIRSPILHLAFSKHFQAHPERETDMLAVAEALVAHGADVNDSYPAEPGSEHRLTAIYGALGHAGNMPLARWLLERGADPNDDETLYHATELGHIEGLKLLMHHGVKTKGTNALLRMLDFDDVEGTRLLLEYGADPNETAPVHPSGQPVDKIPALHQAARRGKDGRYVGLLLDHGAAGEAIWQGHSAYALARIYGNDSFAQALAARGLEMPLNRAEEILAACADGETPSGVPLNGLGLSDEARMILTRVILRDDGLDHAKRLVAAGIDPNQTDEMGMTPLHSAGWAGLPKHLEWLLGLSPDLDHVNGFGGDLISTIVHGSENRLDVDRRDHATCARLALEAGAKLKRSEIDHAFNEDVAAILWDWAEEHPDRIA